MEGKNNPTRRRGTQRNRCTLSSFEQWAPMGRPTKDQQTLELVPRRGGTLPQRSVVCNDRRPELDLSRYQRWSPCAGQVAQIVRLPEQGPERVWIGSRPRAGVRTWERL